MIWPNCLSLRPSSSARVVNDKMLAELAELPHLKTLVLLFPNSVPAPIYVTQEGFAALARSRSLRDLRVGSYLERERQPLLAMARVALPNVPVTEAVIDTLEATLLIALMGILVLPTLGLGFQLSSQFRGPASRLMPGFAAPHALVGVVLAVGLVSLIAARLVFEPGASVAGSILLPSAVVSVALTSTVSIAAREWYQSQINRRSKFAFVVIAFLQLTPLGLLFALFSQTLRQRLLAANDPVTVITLVLIVAASIALTIWTLNSLVDWASEAGLDDRRVPKDVFLWIQQANRIERKPLFKFGKSFRDRQERRIEELSHSGEPLTSWGKIQRWRLGNAPQQPFFLVILITLLITGLAMQGFLGNSTPLQPMPFYYLLMVGVMVGTQWRLRMQVLPMEILRPTSRASLQREWIWALLLDLVPGTISFAALEAAVLNYVPPLGMVWSRVPLDFLVFLPLGICAAAGLASMVVVIRRTWLLVLLGYALFFLTGMATFALGVLYKSGSFNNLGPLNQDGFEALFWFPSLIGLGVAWVMARRWQKTEIGAIA